MVGFAFQYPPGSKIHDHHKEHFKITGNLRKIQTTDKQNKKPKA